MGKHHHHAGNNLRLAFFLNLAFALFEIIGGLYVNSMAILSDAVHDLGDSLSLGIAWYLEKKSKQAADRKFSLGYMRFSLLGALINGIVLILGAIFVIVASVDRILEPEPSNADGMIVFAIIGILVNGFAAWRLSSGLSLNEKVISWHLLEDVLGWLAVLVVAITLKFYQNNYLDPLLSILIMAYILWGVGKRLKETLYLFLQGVPLDINLQDIKQQLLNIKGVNSVKQIQAWSLDGAQHVFTAQVQLNDIQALDQIIRIKLELKKVLRQYPFKYITIETETEQ